MIPAIAYPSESHLIAATLSRIGADQRWRVWRANVIAGTSGARLVRAGVPGQCDISGVMLDGTGRRIELEAKLPGEKPRPRQRVWLELMERARAVVGVFHDELEALEILESAYQPPSHPPPPDLGAFVDRLSAEQRAALLVTLQASGAARHAEA